MYEEGTINEKKIVALICLLLIIVGLLSCTSNSKTDANNLTMLEPEKTWVALLEMNDYPEGYEDFAINYINSKRMKETLIELGVKEEQILVINDELDYKQIKGALDWLNNNSKDGDTVMLYTFAHGSWLRNKEWNKLVAPKWLEIKNRNKIIFVASCSAGEFLDKFIDKDDSGIAIGAASAEEIAWAGLEEEGLPIIGEVFTYYFTKAILDKNSDINNDGFITSKEAFELAVSNTQAYMNDEVFSVEEFLESYKKLGIFPEKLSGYPNPVYINSYEKELVLKKLR